MPLVELTVNSNGVWLFVVVVNAFSIFRSWFCLFFGTRTFNFVSPHFRWAIMRSCHDAIDQYRLPLIAPVFVICSCCCSQRFLYEFNFSLGWIADIRLVDGEHRRLKVHEWQSIS